MVYLFKSNDRKTRLLILGCVMLSLLLTACQNKTESTSPAPVPLPQAPIEVTFSTQPESGIQVGQAVELLAEVTQEGELVADAELVRFEIWLDEENDQEKQEEDSKHSHMEASHAPAGEGEHEHQSMADYNSEHDMLVAENRGNGLYGLTYRFEESGTYSVMYHVDARGFHAMTAHQVIVGE